MKRTLSTVVLFVLLVLTVVALTRIGKPQSTSAVTISGLAAMPGENR